MLKRGKDDAEVPPNDEVADRLGRLEKRRPFRWGLVVGGVVAVAAALLIAQNSHETAFEWLWFDFDAPLWLFLLITLLAGVVVGEAGRLAWQRSRSRRARRRETIDAASERLRGGEG